MQVQRQWYNHMLLLRRCCQDTLVRRDLQQEGGVCKCADLLFFYDIALDEHIRVQCTQLCQNYNDPSCSHLNKLCLDDDCTLC